MLFPFRRENLYGYIDSKGSIIIAPQYSYAGSFSYGRAIIHKKKSDLPYCFEKHIYIIDESGDIIMDMSSEYPECKYVNDYSEGYAYYSVSRYEKGRNWITKYGFLDISGNIAIKPKYEKVNDFKEGMCAVQISSTDTSMVYIDYSDKIVIKTNSSNASDFHEGLARVTSFVDSKKCYRYPYGFIDKYGTYKIVPTYCNARDFYYGIANVDYEYKYGFKTNYYIDIHSSKIEHDYISLHDSFDTGYAVFGIRCDNYSDFKSKKKYIVVDNNWNVIGEFNTNNLYSHDIDYAYSSAVDGLLCINLKAKNDSQSFSEAILFDLDKKLKVQIDNLYNVYTCYAPLINIESKEYSGYINGSLVKIFEWK
jgi:hypothetical protein